jgi:hypothetical protein
MIVLLTRALPAHQKACHIFQEADCDFKFELVESNGVETLLSVLQ